MEKVTKKAYDHKTRKCEFPGCENLGSSQSKHADGTPYRRPWCGFHLKGKGRSERVEYAKGIKKYIPKNYTPNPKII